MEIKGDFEEWFLMWGSVLFYPNPMNRDTVIHKHAGNAGVIPCHQHKACKALVKADTKYPPRVCPGCGVDTQQEFQKLPEESRQQLWLPYR